MPGSKSDLKKDFDEAYSQAVEKWWPWWVMAKKDIQFKLGNPWSESDKTKLKKQERDAHVWNRCRRMVNLLSGWERRNRLSIKIDPIEGADRATADQFSGVAQYTWRYASAYHVLSNAFEKGTVTSGLNLVEVYLDFLRDPVNGDLAFKRLPYNRFLLDPYFTEIDLSDCSYLITRDWLSLSQLKLMIPGKDNVLEGMMPRGRDQKFPDAAPAKDFKGKNLYRVDRFFRRDTKKTWWLTDPSGRGREFDGSRKELDEFLAQEHPALGTNLGQIFTPTEIQKPIVKLGLLVEDEKFYDDDEPTGLEDYPFVPFLGYFEPEHDDWRFRLCGTIRDMRDPQTEGNRLRMKVRDVIDNALDALIIKEDTLINDQQAYQRGPLVLFRKKNSEPNDIEIKQGGGVFPGLLETIQLMDRDIEEIPGGNETLMGLPNKDDPQEAWIMGKLRMSAGLTIFEPLMDNYREALRHLGSKSIQVVQNNYPPQKIARILNKQPSALFYDPDFSRYDVLAVPGLQTESQRQMRHAQLMAMANFPAYQGKIPLSMLLETSDLELSTEFIQQLKQQEQMQMQLMLMGIQEKMSLARAQMTSLTAKAKMQQAQAEKAMADAVKIMAEVKQIPEDRMHKLIQLALELESSGQGPQSASASEMMTRR